MKPFRCLAAFALTLAFFGCVKLKAVQDFAGEAAKFSEYIELTTRFRDTYQREQPYLPDQTAELAQANVSVTGASDKNSNAGAVSAFGTFDNTVRIFYPWDSKASEGFSLNVPSLGPDTWTYNFGANNPNYFGSLTGVKSR